MKFSKQNLMPAVGMALALSVTFTSCIDNSESEGVLAMRQAQAELIKAKASAETTLAVAEAALLNAKAAYENARAELQLSQAKLQDANTAYQLLENEAQALINAIQTARDASEKAELEAELEVVLAKKRKELADAENSILISALTNQQKLAEAQQTLAEALKDVQERVAKDAINNPVLEAYVDQYDLLLTDVNNLQVEIVELTTEIALDKLFAIGGDDSKLVEALAKEIAKLQDDKAEQVALQARYETVLADLSSVNAEILSSRDEIATLEGTISKTDVSLELEEAKVRLAAKAKSDARLAFDGKYYAINLDGTTGALLTNTGYEIDAEFLMDEALDTYNDASALETVIKAFEGNDLANNEVKAELFTVYNYELEESHMISANNRLGGTNYTFREIDFYEDIVSTTSDANDKEDAQQIVEFLTKVVAGYKTEIGGTTPAVGVATLRAAYFTAKDTYLAAETNYDNASDKYDDAVEAKAEFDVVKADANTAITNLKAYITTIKDGKKNEIEDAISDAKDEIINIDESLASLNINATDWTGLIAVKEVKLANKQAKMTMKQQEADAVKVLIDAELAK